MAEERKGFLTANQEQGVDALVEFDGIKEKLDGAAIKLVDNQVLERIKNKIPEQYHNDVYSVVDTIFEAIGIKP